MTFASLVRTLWNFRPRRPYKFWWRYTCWRVETYTGIPSKDIGATMLIKLARQKEMRKSLLTYFKWVDTMRRIIHGCKN